MSKQEYCKEYRTHCKSKGICCRCLQISDTPEKHCCSKCQLMQNEKAKEKRLERLKIGVCTQCGGFVDGQRMCNTCRESFRHKRQKSKLKRLANSICIRCGKKPHVKNSQLCEICVLRNAAFSLWGDRSKWLILNDLYNKQNGKCIYSNLPIRIGIDAWLDHRIPKAKGGTNNIDNLQWIECRINRMKSDLLESEFIFLIKTISAFIA